MRLCIWASVLAMLVLGLLGCPAPDGLNGAEVNAPGPQDNPVVVTPEVSSPTPSPAYGAVIVVLRDRGGVPIPQSANPACTVAVFGLAGQYRASTDDFILENVPAGTWRVGASAHGYLSAERDVDFNPAMASNPPTVTMYLQKVCVPAVLLRDETGAAISPSSIRLGSEATVVVLRDENGEPIHLSGFLSPEGDVFIASFEDYSGSFQIPSLSTDSTAALRYMKDEAGGYIAVLSLGPGALLVALTEVDCGPPSGIIPTCEIPQLNLAGEFAPLVGPDGAYVFNTVPEGQWTVAAGPPDLWEGSATVNIVSAQVSEATVMLEYIGPTNEPSPHPAPPDSGSSTLGCGVSGKAAYACCALVVWVAGRRYRRRCPSLTPKRR